MPWYRDDYDTHTAAAWIAASIASADRGEGAQFAIVDHANALVGIIGLEDIDEQTGRAMLGYWLATPAAGRGVGRRAIGLAIAWARKQPAIRVVWAVVADANRASRRVLELNDFRLAGVRGMDERGDTALIYELELRPVTSASDSSAAFRLTESQRADLVEGVDAEALERLVRLMPPSYQEALLTSFTKGPAGGMIVGFWGTYNTGADEALADVWAPTWQAWSDDEIENSPFSLPVKEILRARLAQRRVKAKESK